MKMPRRIQIWALLSNKCPENVMLLNVETGKYRPGLRLLWYKVYIGMLKWFSSLHTQCWDKAIQCQGWRCRTASPRHPPYLCDLLPSWCMPDLLLQLGYNSQLPLRLSKCHCTPLGLPIRFQVDLDVHKRVVRPSRSVPAGAKKNWVSQTNPSRPAPTRVRLVFHRTRSQDPKVTLWWILIS